MFNIHKCVRPLLLYYNYFCHVFNSYIILTYQYLVSRQECHCQLHMHPSSHMSSKRYLSKLTGYISYQHNETIKISHKYWKSMLKFTQYRDVGIVQFWIFRQVWWRCALQLHLSLLSMPWLMKAVAVAVWVKHKAIRNASLMHTAR